MPNFLLGCIDDVSLLFLCLCGIIDQLHNFCVHVDTSLFHDINWFDLFVSSS